MGSGTGSWPDSRNLRAAPLWDVFAANGRKALAVNVPGSWPPQPIAGGAVVSGIPVPGAHAALGLTPYGFVISSEPEAGQVPTRLRAPGRP